MKIVDCTDPRSSRLPLLLPVREIFLHHCSLSTPGADNPRPIADEDLTGANLSAEFERNSLLGTGQCRPYHVLICTDGTVDQCIRLSLRGAHALAHNVSSIAVATAGEHGLTPAQRAVLPEVLADMLLLSDGAPIRGHTAVPDATRPGHPVCPHPSTDVAAITAEALALLTVAACYRDHAARETAVRARGWQV